MQCSKPVAASPSIVEPSLTSLPNRPLLLTAALAGYLAVFLLPAYARSHPKAHTQAHPMSVANDYSHRAALRLARNVNLTRTKVTRHLPPALPTRRLAASRPARAILVANGYSHQAAVNLARQVNATRAQVQPHPPTARERRLAAHNARLAQEQAARATRLAQIAQKRQARLAQVAQKQAQTQTKLARQHQALTSGNVVVAADSFRGTRYVRGGTSRSGFDCSGFVRYILSHTGGVDLPRTATEQYYKGAPIPVEQLQPGDLVFFKNTYKHGISHVGIYAGNGQFIHAANAHKGVRTDTLNAKYYWQHYAGARRVLPADMRRAVYGN